jgi:protein subunit release factor A
MKKILFSLTAKDFRWDVFRAGGKGGQKQNKTSSGVRCVHEPSGAVGEGRDERSQHANRKNAFSRCVSSNKFKTWHKMEVAKRLYGSKSIDEIVDSMMIDNNLKIEYTGE